MKPIYRFTAFLVILFTPMFAFGENILSVEHGDLKITLTERINRSFDVTVETGKPGVISEVFALENPSRLVIDVLDIQSRRSFSETIKHTLFSSLRIGIHPSKTRLVFDINYPQQPFFSSKTLGSKILVHVGLPGISPQEQAKVETKEAVEVEAKKTEPMPVEQKIVEPAPPAKTEPNAVVKPTEPKVEAKTPEKQEVAKKVDVPEIAKPLDTITKEKELPQKESAKVEVEEVGLSPSIEEKDDSIESAPDGFFIDPQEKAIVKNIVFKRTQDKENAIAIEVEHLGRYSFLKSAPQSYSLVIENAQAEEENVVLTQFPPQDYKGIEAVTAYRKGKNIIVKVYVEKGITLLPYRQGNELWIKAS
jgi:hypothetical protein